jgi:rare lipoprotein A (peptidoglycan hydrolase)
MNPMDIRIASRYRHIAAGLGACAFAILAMTVAFDSGPADAKTNPAPPVATTQVGTASWYGPRFHGRKTANGETFNQRALTAAHRKLPLGTVVEVTSLDTGRSVTVRINDRGPYIEGRIIDLSHAAAERLGIVEQGVGKVRLQVVEAQARTSLVARRS